MTLRGRLTLGLLTIAVILIVPLVIAARSLDRLHAETKAMRDGDFAASLHLGKMRDALNDVSAAELAVLFVREEKSGVTMADKVAVVERLADTLEAYDLARAALEIRRSMAIVSAGARSEHEAVLAHRDAEAETLSKQQVNPAIKRAELAVNVAERTLRERARERVAHATSAARSARGAAISGLVLALLVAAVIAVRLARSVSRPVYELERGMRQVADGDFTAKLAIKPSEEDEFGRLAISFDAMSRQLAELDRLKAEFVSVASHELKTPINVILGYAQLLREQVLGPLTAKQRQVAEVLENQTKQLSRLVKQLLDVTRFDANGARLDIRPLELSRFLNQLGEAFQVLADQRGVRFQVSLHDGLPDTVHWDADRVNEVLGNLLANAFKFTNRGGEVELTVLPTDHSVQMEVRDSGVGIPQDQISRIFEKFYQADNQASASHSGTGLGLAIARQIVEAHNGSITCESTPGVGTTFTIVLPQQVTSRRSSAKAHAAASVG